MQGAGDAAVASANTALVTTAETVVATSPAVSMPSQRARVLIFAWAQLTTGTNTTSVTPHIRRGATAAGTLVNEANAEGVKIAAGGTEPFCCMAVDEISDVNALIYSLTLEQAGASANGNCLQAGIEVRLLP